MGFERDSANRDALSLQIEKSIFDAPAKGVLLRIANKIYPAKRYSFLPEFMEGLKANYRIAIEPLDFEAAPEPSRQKINRWVAEKTSNKIQGLLPSGSIDEYTRMVLVNAIYLKAPWEIPFKKSETRNESFKGLRNKKKVPTMHRLDNMEVFIGRNYKALTLYYKNSPLSMLLVLPNEGYALANLEDELKAEDFRMMLNRKQMRFVKLALPKFRQELKVDGKGMLETLGALLAFSDAAADF
ncbi:MAG: serpin family protein [Bradymonadales bacterium]